jgi:hypothetical protein
LRFEPIHGKHAETKEQHFKEPISEFNVAKKGARQSSLSAAANDASNILQQMDVQKNGQVCGLAAHFIYLIFHDMHGFGFLLNVSHRTTANRKQNERRKITSNNRSNRNSVGRVWDCSVGSNPDVAGSNPAGWTTFFLLSFHL